jgi:DNA (cytosine-5)-methyltransferase 1
MLRVLDLFSGIGGFSLGLERAGGFRTVAFCEIDSFCRKVLAKHWPGVPCYHDVRELTADRLAADGIAVDVICGGFPCQDISVAGKGAGMAGERSGLWSEYARLIGELRPRLAIVENVAALLSRGLADVLGDLAALGYDAEWHCIPASAVGAPHRRDRVWIVADADRHARLACGPRHADEGTGGRDARLANASNVGCNGRSQNTRQQARTSTGIESSGPNVADAESAGLEKRATSITQRSDGIIGRRELRRCYWWLVEPDVGRVANGVPSRVDRLRSLGNAVVPQIPELIGRAIMQ